MLLQSFGEGFVKQGPRYKGRITLGYAVLWFPPLRRILLFPCGITECRIRISKGATARAKTRLKAWSIKRMRLEQWSSCAESGETECDTPRRRRYLGVKDVDRRRYILRGMRRHGAKCNLVAKLVDALKPCMRLESFAPAETTSYLRSRRGDSVGRLFREV